MRLRLSASTAYTPRETRPSCALSALAGLLVSALGPRLALPLAGLARSWP